MRASELNKFLDFDGVEKTACVMHYWLVNRLRGWAGAP